MAQDEQMGQLVLVLGDLHIPQRCAEIPLKYKQMITPNKVTAVLCTGNVGSKQVYQWIKSLSNNFNIVKGDYEDDLYSDLQEEKVVEIAGIKIGLIHGHQIIPWADEDALYNKAKKLGVNVLISGHTHDIKFVQHNGVYLINPGSMTGAYSSIKLNAPPAFMILEFKSTQITIYEYTLTDGELNCVDTRIKKP